MGTVMRPIMYRQLMLVVLMLSVTSAWAEWTEVDENAEHGLTVYVDFATIRQSGNLVKVWALSDYKTMQTNGPTSYVSSKSQWQYDCQEEKRRLLAFTEFSKNMGTGDVIYSDSDPTKWIPVEPGSIAEDLFKIVCSKK